MALSRTHIGKQTAKSRISSASEPKAVSAEPALGPRAAHSARPDRQAWILIAAILILTCLAFANALNGEFVYDDWFQILKNPAIQTLTNLPKMFTQSVWQFQDPTSDQPIGSYYRPLFNIALIINYHVFGLQVFGWHLFSLLLHLMVTFLVYRLAQQWGLPRDVAAASALLFGLHPVHSESVAWISALPDPLAAVFIFSSLALYERYYHGSGGRWYLLTLSWELTLLAMFSKEVAIVFPLFLMLREWFDRSRGEPLSATLSRLVPRMAPFMIVTTFYLGLRYYVMGFISKADAQALGIPNGHVFLTIPSILLSYARMLFIPYPLAIMYGHTYVPSAADPRFWGSAVAVTALIAGTIGLVRSSRVGRWALLWLVLFLLPVLNLKAFNQEESLLHDRYLYLPSFGFCLLLALALTRISARLRSGRRRAFVTATVFVVIPLFGLTVYQNRSWQSGLAMANYARRVAPEWPFLYRYLGAYYAKQGKLAEAEQVYLRAVKAQPTYCRTYLKSGTPGKAGGLLSGAASKAVALVNVVKSARLARLS